jgi:hypothetical protein
VVAVQVPHVPGVPGRARDRRVVAQVLGVDGLGLVDPTVLEQERAVGVAVPLAVSSSAIFSSSASAGSRLSVAFSRSRSLSRFASSASDPPSPACARPAPSGGLEPGLGRRRPSEKMTGGQRAALDRGAGCGSRGAADRGGVRGRRSGSHERLGTRGMRRPARTACADSGLRYWPAHHGTPPGHRRGEATPPGRAPSARDCA